MHSAAPVGRAEGKPQQAAQREPWPTRPPSISAARYVFPVAGPPRPQGVLSIEGERIVALDAPNPAAPTLDLGSVAIVPGLVNAHTHLEFSDLTQPLGEPAMPFADWIRRVIAERGVRQSAPAENIARGLVEAVRSGTTTLADIATSRWPSLADPPADAIVFRESIGLRPEQIAERMATAVAELDFESRRTR